jgi:hypothetical protein
LQFDISFSVEAIWVTLGLAVLTVAIPVALSFRTLPENSIIVGTNSAAISAQCHEARRQPDVQKEQVSEAQSRSEGHTAISLTNDEIQPVIEREDGIEMLQINTSPDRPQNGSNNAIEAEDDRELRGVASREIEPPSNGNDIATPQGESLANVPNENDASPPDESGQTIPQENPQSAPNDPTATNSVPKPPWLQLLQWGVLVEGSTDRNNPGQLGLAPIKNIISKPKDGHFYE